MGLLFEMENDFVDIKNMFFVRGSDKAPIEFKVGLIKIDEPYTPQLEVNGFNTRSMSRNVFGSNIEVSFLEYDAILKIGDTVMRMQFQEFMNLASTLSNRADKLQRQIANSATRESINAIINTIQQRSSGGNNETTS